MHLKRQKVPKNWPVARKGTAYVVNPSHGLRQGVPLLIVLREILKLAKNRKEVKKALNENNILLNGKVMKEERHGVALLDVITIVPSKKSFRLTLNEKGKFAVEGVPENSAKSKIAKIMNKKTLKGKKVQLNLSDGGNVLSEIPCKVGDSVIISFNGGKGKNSAASKCLEFKEKAKTFVIGGKHAGAKGTINKIDKERKIVEVISEVGTEDKDKKEKEKINVLIKHLIVIE